MTTDHLNIMKDHHIIKKDHHSIMKDNVTINDMSVICVTAHSRAGDLEKKVGLR